MNDRSDKQIWQGYEIIYDCPDAAASSRLAGELQRLASAVMTIERGEVGGSSSLTLRFSDTQTADRFFDGTDYERFCEAVRARCRSAVLVVPLGRVE